MLIANPIYDTVFKYLMEDPEISKGLLSEILGREIISLVPRPQEAIVEVPWQDILLKVYRLDYTAIIKDEDGTVQKVLIELQKSKAGADVQRFRHYLAQNYRKTDALVENGKEVQKALEIITIYFLGFKLDYVDVPVLWVKNDYVNMETGHSLAFIPNEPFIRLLNHESYTIQIPLLKGDFQTRLLQMLKVFSQEYITSDVHFLNYQGNADTPLVSLMLSRLQRAIADENLQKQMDFEDEIGRTYLKDLQEMSERMATAEEGKRNAEEGKRKAEEEKRKAEDEKKSVLSLSIKALISTGMLIESVAENLNISVETVQLFLTN